MDGSVFRHHAQHHHAGQLAPQPTQLTGTCNHSDFPSLDDNRDPHSTSTRPTSSSIQGGNSNMLAPGSPPPRPPPLLPCPALALPRAVWGLSS
eukprot:862576-Pelagomonas_calceolata.AAC.7